MNELDISHYLLIFAAPRLFLILPSDLELRDHSDPSTHTFRLYFMCDCQYKKFEDRRPYVHISNHSGYHLDRPLEFIRQFGQLSLTILEAVETGYIGPEFCIPKLDSFQILDNFRGNAIQQQLTSATIGPLVNKAITYIYAASYVELVLRVRKERRINQSSPLDKCRLRTQTSTGYTFTHSPDNRARVHSTSKDCRLLRGRGFSFTRTRTAKQCTPCSCTITMTAQPAHKSPLDGLGAQYRVNVGFADTADAGTADTVDNMTSEIILDVGERNHLNARTNRFYIFFFPVIFIVGWLEHRSHP